MSDTQMFEYDAPTYVDFAKGFDESEDVDKFFDTVADNPRNQTNLNSTALSNANLTVPKSELDFCTPDKHSTPEPNNCTPHVENIEQENLTPNFRGSCKTPLDGRRSRVLFEALEGLCPGSLKTHNMVTRKDPRTPLLELRSRTVPRNVNFMFTNEKGESETKMRVAREIVFEDETDSIIDKLNNLSVGSGNDENMKQICDSDFREIVNETITFENAMNQEAQENIKRHVQFCNDEIGGQKRRSESHSPSTSFLQCNKYIRLVPAVGPPLHENKLLKENKLNSKTNWHRTLPKTPNLQTKSRARPCNFLSHSQEEERIMKILRENQPKAQAIPKGLFDPPKLCVRRMAVSKYTYSTQTKQPISTATSNQVVKAPKVITNGAKNDFVKVVEINEAGMSVITKGVGHHGVGSNLDKNNKNKSKGPTKPQPFSFYECDLERQRKKEEKIKKIIEEEKKLAEFKANPLPRFVLKVKNKKASSLQSLNYSVCSHSTTCSVKSDHYIFKANPPSVLNKKPFMPRKSMKPCAKVSEFTLHTEERSQQRDIFESTKKQREIQMQLLLQEKEREQKAREEAAYRTARKSTVHKPVPLPKFK